MKIIIKKEKKWHEKVLGPIAMIILLAFGYILWKDEVTVNTRETVTLEYPVDEVVREKSEIIIHGFTGDISNIKWLDNQNLLLYGSNGKWRDAFFQIDLEELGILTPDVQEADVQEYVINDRTLDQYKIIYKSDHFEVFYIYDDEINGLYLYDLEGSFKLISTKVKLDDMSTPLVKISDNKQKMLYLEMENNKLVVYNLKSEKKKVINQFIETDDLFERAILSEDGGFVIYSVPQNAEGKPVFYCYGTDSGNAYVNEVEGINPIFSKESDKIYYLYYGDMDSSFSGKRLGIISLKDKSIKYITSDENEAFYFNYKPASQNQLVCLMGVVDKDQFIIDKIARYDANTNEMRSTDALKGTKVDLSTPFEVIDQLFILISHETDLTMLNLENQEILNFTNLTTLPYLEQKQLYIPYQDGYIIGYQNAIYKINQNGKTLVFRYNGDLHQLSISPDEDKMLIASKNDNELNLVVTYKLEIEY